MYNSILQFIQNDIKEIEKNVREILDGTKDAADLSNDIHERVLKLGSRIVGEIYEQIQSGRSLTEAFRDQKDVLPSIMFSMISAGEESGRLDEIMERLAIHFQKESKLNHQVIQN